MSKFREFISEENEEALFLTEAIFDKALIGVGRRCGQPSIAVYDAKQLIDCYMEMGMTHEEAEEFFEYNTVGAWLGEHTPIFVTMPDIELID